MSIGALRKHIASLPEQVFIDQPDGFLRGLHQAIKALLLCLVCQLPGNILLVGLIPGHGVGTGYHSILLGLLGRILRGYHGDGAAGTGIGTRTAAQAFIYINNAVLCVCGPSGANVQAQTVLSA